MADGSGYETRGCACTDGKEYFISKIFCNDALRGELELLAAGDVEWLLFSYT